MTFRARLSAALIALAAVLLAIVSTLFPTPQAQADTSSDGNPWTYTMSEDAPGLRIYGSTGGDNRIQEWFDHNGWPVAGVNEAGGLWVAGDEFRVFNTEDILHGQITVSPFTPRADVCVRNGQLWIGGPGGQIWRCVDFDGGAWNGGWWPANV